jgi:hypothetical protein
MERHYTIHQQSLCGKPLKSEDVMTVVVSVVNFIRSHGLNRRQFQSVLSELDAEYWGHLVSYRSPMAESWDSAETFCNFEAREVGG